MKPLWFQQAWNFTNQPMPEVARFLRLQAWRGTFDGMVTQENSKYCNRCTARHTGSGSILIFRRDTGHHSSGWFKNPDYERCLHLSLSYREHRSGESLPQRRDVSDAWARAFFGQDLRLAWIEPPATPEGRARDVLHYRLFCNERWQPIHPRGEVYSTEFTGKGWKSASELRGKILYESPLNP